MLDWAICWGSPNLRQLKLRPAEEHLQGTFSLPFRGGWGDSCLGWPFCPQILPVKGQSPCSLGSTAIGLCPFSKASHDSVPLPTLKVNCSAQRLRCYKSPVLPGHLIPHSPFIPSFISTNLTVSQTRLLCLCLCYYVLHLGYFPLCHLHFYTAYHTRHRTHNLPEVSWTL